MKFFKEIKDPADKCIVIMLSYLWVIIMVGMALSFLKGTRMDIDAVAETAFSYP